MRPRASARCSSTSAPLSPHATVTTGLGLTPRLLTDGTQIRSPATGSVLGPRSASATRRVDRRDARRSPTRSASTYRCSPLTGRVTIAPAKATPPMTRQCAPDRQLSQHRRLSVPQLRLRRALAGRADGRLRADALFVRVNPCGLWGGDCSFNSGILNPAMAIEWPIISKALSSSNGHCFGISRAVQEFLAGHRSLRAVTTAGSAFAIPRAAHPQTAVGHFLDAEHALQASAEFLGAWFNRAKSVRTSSRD